jgi:hypothetical protein
MAKVSKHSPALFEVVHGKKHFDKTARDTALRTPSWWFKGRKRMTEVGALAPAGGGTAVDEPPPFDDDGIPTSAADPTENPAFLAARDRERNAQRNGERDSERSGERDVSGVGPERSTHDAGAPAEPMAIPAALVVSPHSRHRSAFQFLVDRDRHELFVRVRYTTAVVAGVSVLMLVALAYLTGRHTGRGPSSALASAEEIARGPVEKGVLDLNPRGGANGAAFSANSPSPAFTSSGAGAARPPAARAMPTTQAPAFAPTSVAPSRPGVSPSEPTAPPAPPVSPQNNGKRVVGHQYVLVQSYPPEQKKTAEDARDLLAQAGVVTTVEKAPIGWPPTWFSVVGTTGFDRASGPAYQNYLGVIESVNNKFAGKGSFKRFDPTAIRWKERAD